MINVGKSFVSISSLFEANMKAEATLEFRFNEDVGKEIHRLGTDPKRGLASSAIEAQRQKFGANRYSERETTTFIDRLIEGFKDPTIKILIAAAAVSLVLGVFSTGEYKDGIAILIAVVIAAGVGAWNEHQKDREFQALKTKGEDLRIKVIRDGQLAEISSLDLVAGDVVELATGGRAPVDGIVLRAVDLQMDESSMTGESEPADKDPGARILSGTTVTEGRGAMLVTAVGDESEWGKLRLALESSDDATPLQERLGELANTIGKVGMGAAILTFGALLIQGIFFKHTITMSLDANTWATLVEAAIIAITIVVVAVPEGLPLAVTASLAYSVRKMMKDQNLVRRLMACETMGAATVVCSDKTGTLTRNQMTVAAAFLGGRDLPAPIPADGPSAELTKILCDIAAINSTASLHVDGSATEKALLRMVEGLGGNYVALRENANIEHQSSFSSHRKRMTTILREGDTIRLLTKGAPEVLLARCDRWYGPSGVEKLDDAAIAQINKHLLDYAQQSHRVLALAYGTAPAAKAPTPIEELEQGLVLAGLVAISDPVRDEVPLAVARANRAGVEVKMITGDNRATAEAIGRRIGMIKEADIILEGPQVEKMTDEELLAALPRMRILARSSPSDKLRIVQLLKLQRHVVAVTGDGTNDAPALRGADVGLSMGMSGTEVAKEASDIVLMDDNFVSVVSAIRWGRSVFENIRKFLQFQLTVNVAALATAFFGALFGFGSPLTAVQLLWVNLIMDTLAALALALEPPSDALLDQKPHGRHAPLITPAMWISILVSGTYQFLLLMGMLFMTKDHYGIAHTTMIFNTFVFLQLFNELNCRSTRFDRGVLKGLFSSTAFLTVVGTTAFIQVLIVQLGGASFRTVPLSLNNWIVCIGLGATMLVVGMLIRTIGRLVMSREQWEGQDVARDHAITG